MGFLAPLARRNGKAPQRPGKRDFAWKGLRRASQPGLSPLWPASGHPAWRPDRTGQAAGERGEGPAEGRERLSGRKCVMFTHSVFGSVPASAAPSALGLWKWFSLLVLVRAPVCGDCARARTGGFKKLTFLRCRKL